MIGPTTHGRTHVCPPRSDETSTIEREASGGRAEIGPDLIGARRSTGCRHELLWYHRRLRLLGAPHSTDTNYPPALSNGGSIFDQWGPLLTLEILKMTDANVVGCF